jgi:hypothetical protein
MAAIITSPPIIVDPVQYSRTGTPALGDFFGPYQYGTKQYVLLSPQSGQRGVKVFSGPQSFNPTDVWTVLDAANAPATLTSVSGGAFATGANKIHFFYIDSGVIKVGIFDLITETYDLVTISDPPDVVNDHILIASLSNGDVLLSWEEQDSILLVKRVFVVVYDSAGATWGAKTLVSTGAPNAHNVFSKVTYCDENDVVHFIYQDFTGASYYHNQIAPDGTLGTATSIDPGQTTVNNFVWQIAGYLNQLIVPFASFTGFLGFYVGTPLNDPTTWTSVVTTFPAAAAQFGFCEANPFPFVRADGSIIVFFFNFVAPGIFQPPTEDSMYYTTSTDGLIWTAPVLYYDALGNPPVDADATENYLHNPSASETPTGDLSVFVTMDIFPPPDGQQFCAACYLAADVIPPPPTPPTPVGGPGAGGPGGFGRCVGRAAARRSFLPWRPKSKRTCD